jgi:hypothetical protein
VATCRTQYAGVTATTISGVIEAQSRRHPDAIAIGDLDRPPREGKIEFPCVTSA